MAKISIVLTYHNRQKLLEKTLLSFAESEHKDFNVVIVDDCSPEDIVLPKLPYQVSILKLQNKTWLNVAPVFNMGFNYALLENPDIIIFQSAECYHVGDIISYASKITNDDYISFGCFQIDKNATLNGHDINSLVKDIKHNVQGFNRDVGQNCWWNHPVHAREGLYWCAAITAQNLKKLNGIDERFSYGYAHEDSYFLYQVESLGLKIEITANPFVVHQWHPAMWLPGEGDELIKKNIEILDEGRYRLRDRNEKSYRSKHIITQDL
jgi:glycosyltransferase involved in cell wall biosynthesis